MRPVLVRMETSAVFMAMAYARVSGRVGVVHASPGPGMANLVPGLLEAQYACSPLVCVVSAAGREHEGSGGFQDTPSLAMVRPVTKWAVRIDLPERTSWTMQRAFAVAQNGKPGPVFVEIPVDVAAAEAEIPAYRRPLTGLRSAGDPAAVEQASRLLAASERPVIWAGGGVGLSGAEDALVALAETLDAPVVTTPSGRGSISEAHRLAFGSVGLYRTRSSARPVDESDCVLYVGTRLEEFQTGLGRYLPATARVIQVDVDPFEIERNIAADVAVVGDAKLVLEQLADSTPARARTPVDGGAGRVQGGVRARRRERVLSRQRRAVEDEAGGARTQPRLRGRLRARARERRPGPLVVLLPVREGDSAPRLRRARGADRDGARRRGRDRREAGTTRRRRRLRHGRRSVPDVHEGDPHGAAALGARPLGRARQREPALGRSGSRGRPASATSPSISTCSPTWQPSPRRAGRTRSGSRSPEELDAALERARSALRDGRPAVLVCAIDTWDYPEGFVEFHRDVWGLELPDEGSTA